MKVHSDIGSLRLFKIGVCLLLLVLSSTVKAGTFDWTGRNSTDVTDAGNWAQSGLIACPVAPGANDDVRIGVATTYTLISALCVNLGSQTLTLTRFPIVSANTTWKSLTFGNNGVTAATYYLRNTSGAQQSFGTKYTMMLTVNGATTTLTVTGNINQNHYAGAADPRNIFNAIIAGTGSVLCQGNVVVGDAATQPSSTVADVALFSAQVNQLTINGNVLLNCNGINNATRGEVCYPCFSVEKGTTTLLGQMNLVKNFSPPTSGFAGLNPGVLGFTGYGQVIADNTGYASTAASSPSTFELKNKTPIITPLIDQFYIYFTFGGNSGTTLFSDNNAENQTVYTANEPSTTTTATYINTTSPAYYNLTFSGASTKVVDKNSTIGIATPQGLSVGNNWTTGGGTVNLNTNDPTVTITGAWTNLASTIVNQDAGDIIIKGAVNNTGTLNLGSANLSIGGNYTNNSGGVYTQSTGTTFFNGTGAQTLLDNSTAGTVFNKVTFNGANAASVSTMTAGTGNFAVSPTGILSMVSPAKLVAGTSSTAYLTLKSTAASSATVGPINYTTPITGNVNVERYLQGGSTSQRGYRLMSSPVNTGSGIFNVNYVAAKAFISGYGGTANGFNATANNNPTLYFYQENVPVNNNTFTSGTFKGLEKLTAGSNTVNITGVLNITLPVGNGFMFYFIGDNINNLGTGAGQKGGTVGLAPETVTLSASGALNQGPISFTPWAYTGASATLSKHNPGTGYYLLGNPYASSLDLNNTNLKSGGTGINFSNTAAVSTKFLVFNPVNKGYSYWDPTIGASGNSDGNGASRYLGSGQGFFITIPTVGPTTTVTFTEAAKVSTNQQPAPLLMSAPGQMHVANLRSSTAQSVNSISEQATGEVIPDIKLRLSADSVRNDNCAIYFKDDWLPAYSQQEDGIDLDGLGASVFLSSYSADSVRLALNKYSTLTAPRTVIPLYVSATTSGIYTFSKNEISGLPDNYTVFLHDKLLNDSLDMTHNNTYNFNLDRGNAATYGGKRFELVINKSPSKYHLLSFTGKKATKVIDIRWLVEYEDDFTFFVLEKQDQAGNFSSIYQLKSNGTGNYSYTDLLASTGDNVYRLKQTDRDGTVSYSQKISIVYTLQSPNGSVVKVYPNPAESQIQMQIADESSNKAYSLSIIGPTGFVMSKRKVTGSNWTANVGYYTPGIYIVNLYDASNGALVGQGKFIKR